MKIIDQTKRRFTLFLRNFATFYWFDGNLNFTKWWQCGRRRFFICTRTFVKPTFSTWKEIESRVKIDDKDAELIKQCILKLSDYVHYHGMSLTEIYNEMVDNTNN